MPGVVGPFAGVIPERIGSSVWSGLEADLVGDAAVVLVLAVVDLELDRSMTGVRNAWKVVRAEESPSSWRSVSDNRRNVLEYPHPSLCHQLHLSFLRIYR